MTDSKNYIRCFWGKARGAIEDQPAWHPLAYHSIDVAAVADEILLNAPRKLKTFSSLLSLDVDATRHFMVALIALHDIGKFSPYFQAKCPDLWPETVGRILSNMPGDLPGVRHDADGFALRRELNLLKSFGTALDDWVPSDFAAIWCSICGHHGQPVRDESAKMEAFQQDPDCLQAAEEFCRDVLSLRGTSAKIPQPSEPALDAMSWHLSGLTVVADWIGSNRDWFPYREPELDVADYWKSAAKLAKNAVKVSGVLSAQSSGRCSPQQLFPHIATMLSPLQLLVRDLALVDSPQLVLIEDVTGAGKTEAALILAQRLMAMDRANGIYFALPTMATANAMYDRLITVCAKFYADGERPSLVLAHGKSGLNAAFAKSILELDRVDEDYDDESAAVCAGWIADDRRKAFLADIGVGTIDQALLGVLPSRHQTMRLWGLADKVLIIDEAHAYDPYVNREMERLLMFHAALGGSAIVLSATLPETQRVKLTNAFRAGLEAEEVMKVEAAETPYPLVTVATTTTVTSQAVASRPDRKRNLPVRRISTFDAVLSEIETAVASGACVAWIRNAVDDAIDAVAALQARKIQSTLLHARFAMGDRLSIEKTVCDVLGKKGSNEARRGFVVVGTQILEQSLDYDVDTMIVDLAPVDLMIQRAGRLWRHSERTDRPSKAAELLVLSPDPDHVDDADWYRQISQRGASVYRDHGLVWRSARALFDAGEISTPDGVRGLVEAVYGDNSPHEIPKPLQAASGAAIGDGQAARALANANLLKLKEGYRGSCENFTRDQITPTRLGERVTVFRLGMFKQGAVVPWFEDRSLMRAWSLSEVSIAHDNADDVPPVDEPDIAAAIASAKQIWPKWERDMPLLILKPSDKQWRGVVSRAGKERAVVYDTVQGFRFAET